MSYTREVRNDAASIAQNATGAVVDAAADLAVKANAKIDQAKSAASDLASDAMKKGREAGQQIDAVAGNLKGAVDKSIAEQPMATLAVAALAGFVIGAIWKS